MFSLSSSDLDVQHSNPRPLSVARALLLNIPAVVSSQGKHCAPTDLEMYYTEQQQRGQPGPEERGTIGAGFYAALSHLNKVKRTRPEMVSPWLPVIGTLKEGGGGPARESMEEEPQEAELERME